MENLFSHDNLQRVEPTAKSQAEALQKQAADTIATEKSQLVDMEEKEVQMEESNPADVLENEGKLEGHAGRQESEEKMAKKKKRKQKNQYMGGQLFDTEA